MTPRVLRLAEHRTTRGVALEDAELAELSGCGARLSITPRAPGSYDITAAEMVGAVATRRLRVVIEPKVPVARLVALLCFATTRISFHGAVAADERRDLLSIMQTIYATALDRAMRRGLPYAYRHREDRLQTVRGRIDAAALVTKRFGVFPPIDCSFDDFTADIEVNRRMLAAALLLGRHDRGSSAAARLSALAARMSDVTEIGYDPRRLVPLPADRRFDDVRVPLTLAEIVLRNGSVELEDGATATLGFLVDMDRLFEDVVVEGLRPHFGRRWRWRRQPRGLYLDMAARVDIWPDAILDSVPKHADRLVVEMKYKATSEGKHPDLYQVTAYCHATGASRAAIIYADVTPQRLHVRRDGPTIHLLRFDLDCEPDVLAERFASLAAELREIAAS